MRISQTELPERSVLNSKEVVYDYTDSFEGALRDREGNIGPVEIAKSFFRSGPKWIETLFALRNKIVALFGLKTPGKITNKQEMLSNFQFEPGDELGLFKVFFKTPEEIVMGQDDRHLDFRVSLFVNCHINEKTHKTVTISTTVKFHNWMDRIYFLPVKVFHRLIVPSILKGIIKDLEN